MILSKQSRQVKLYVAAVLAGHRNGLQAVRNGHSLDIGEQDGSEKLASASDRPVVRVTPGACPTRRFRFEGLDQIGEARHVDTD